MTNDRQRTAEEERAWLVECLRMRARVAERLANLCSNADHPEWQDHGREMRYRAEADALNRAARHFEGGHDRAKDSKEEEEMSQIEMAPKKCPRCGDTAREPIESLGPDVHEVALQLYVRGGMSAENAYKDADAFIAHRDAVRRGAKLEGT